MYEFRSPRDAGSVPLPKGLRQVVRDALLRLVASYAASGFPFDPDVDGYVVVSDETGDDPEVARLLGVPFPDALLEGVTFHADAGCFEAVVLTSNESGYTVVIPDSPDLLPSVRAKLLDHLPEGEVAP